MMSKTLIVMLNILLILPAFSQSKINLDKSNSYTIHHGDEGYFYISDRLDINPNLHSLEFVFHNKYQSMSISLRGAQKIDSHGEAFLKFYYPHNTFSPVCNFPIHETSEFRVVFEPDNHVLGTWYSKIKIQCN
jgi:hypothetical protein